MKRKTIEIIIGSGVLVAGIFAIVIFGHLFGKSLSIAPPYGGSGSFMIVPTQIASTQYSTTYSVSATTTLSDNTPNYSGIIINNQEYLYTGTSQLPFSFTMSQFQNSNAPFTLSESGLQTNTYFNATSLSMSFGGVIAEGGGSISVQNASAECEIQTGSLGNSIVCTYSGTITSSDGSVILENEYGESFTSSLNVEILSQGVQCTQTQISLCNSGYICSPTNQCIPPTTNVYIIQNGECILTQVPSSQITSSDYTDLQTCQSNLPTPPQTMQFYELSNNTCNLVTLQVGQNTTSDYPTLNQCQSNIVSTTTPTTTTSSSTNVVIAAVLALLVIAIIIVTLAKRKR